MNRSEKARLEIQRLFKVQIEIPQETPSDLMREAQSTLDYFHTGGQDFVDKICKQCGLMFAYRWDSTGVAYCSMPCAKQALAAIGITWNPTKPLQERWGKTVPSVVPPFARDILLSSSDVPGDRPQNTSTE